MGCSVGEEPYALQNAGERRVPASSRQLLIDCSLLMGGGDFDTRSRREALASTLRPQPLRWRCRVRCARSRRAADAGHQAPTSACREITSVLADGSIARLRLRSRYSRCPPAKRPVNRSTVLIRTPAVLRMDSFAPLRARPIPQASAAAGAIRTTLRCGHATRVGELPRSRVGAADLIGRTRATAGGASARACAVTSRVCTSSAVEPACCSRDRP